MCHQSHVCQSVVDWFQILWRIVWLSLFALNRSLRNSWYSLSPVSKALISLHVTSVATICCVTMLCEATFKDVITNGLCRDWRKSNNRATLVSKIIVFRPPSSWWTLVASRCFIILSFVRELRRLVIPVISWNNSSNAATIEASPKLPTITCPPGPFSDLLIVRSSFMSGKTAVNLPLSLSLTTNCPCMKRLKSAGCSNSSTSILSRYHEAYFK